MSLKLITSPAEEPITLAQAKNNSSYAENDLDGLFLVWIKAARIYAENYTHRQFITSTYEMKLDKFTKVILLPKPPVQSVTSITYVDDNGVTQTWNSALYDVDIDAEPARIQPAYDQSYPSARTQMNAITVTYVAGYGDHKAVPETIKQSIYLLVSHWLEHRESVTEINLNKAPFAVDALLMAEKFVCTV